MTDMEIIVWSLVAAIILVILMAAPWWIQEYRYMGEP